MPEPTPAAELRTAAATLREHVGYLHLVDVRGPWSAHAGPTGYPQTVNNIGVPILVCSTYTDPKAPPTMANYIALMHPGIGRALADWLESAAEDAELIGADHHALAVARKINAKEQP